MARIPIPVGAWGNISVSGKRGAWRAAARIRLANGQTVPRFRTGTTKEQAIAALRDHLNEMRDQIIGGEVAGSTTLTTFAGDWVKRWADAETRPPSTVRTYESAVKWIREELGLLRLTECSTGRLEKGVQRIAQKHGDATARQARIVLRHIFADAVRLDALTVNPALGVSTIHQEAPEIRPMTPDEVGRLREAARKWERKPTASYRPWRREIADSIDVLLGTAMRTAELLGNRWVDLNLDAEEPTTEVVGIATRGANGEGIIWKPAPKSEASKRTLYLPRFTVAAYRRQLELREYREESEAVFPSEAGTWRDPSSYRKHFREVREMAGLDWVTPKTIRKTVATAVDSAEGLDTASRQLGHADVRITAKHYVQKLNIGPKEVTGVLDEWFQSAS